MKIHLFNAPVLAVTCMVLLLCTGIRICDGEQADDLQLKVEYLYNFSKYVQWPDDVPSSAGTTFDICVMQGSALAGQLKMLEKRQSNGRLVLTHTLAHIRDSAPCDVLFLGASDRARVKRVLDFLSGRPVLTVSDLNGFALQGGMIELAAPGRKYLFLINVDSVRKADLQISSRLLKLSTIIREMRF